MMTHPMHLHGMWSDLENEKGDVQVRRHTIPVQPAQRISFLTISISLLRSEVFNIGNTFCFDKLFFNKLKSIINNSTFTH